MNRTAQWCGWRGAVACAVILCASGAARAALDQSPAAGPQAVERFALVIGNNQPEGKSAARLRYADDDAVSTHQLLLEAGVHSVLLSRMDDDTRRLHPGFPAGEPPRGAAFDAAVAELFTAIRDARAHGKNTELLIFYSGHGDVAGGEGYVLLEDRRLMRGDLYALLSRSPATRNHVFVDACKSYFFAFEKAAGGHRTSYVHSFAPDAEPGRLTNVGFVLSTSSDRDSHEWERFQAGILSYELRSALRGAADVDGDGRVTYAELGAFLTRANDSIQNPRFRPDFLVRPPEKNLRQEVLRWAAHSAAVHFSARAAESHLYIENARGERILDAHAAADQRLAVHLPSERPLFVRRHDESSEYVIRSAAPISIAALEDSSPAVATRGALHLAFEQLFAAPYGAGDVVAFQDQQDRAARGGGGADLTAVGDTASWSDGDGDGDGGRWFRTRGQRVFAGIALGGLVAGLTLNALAWQRYASSAGASQMAIADANRTVHTLNLTSLVGYAVAAAAGATWGCLGWQQGLALGIDAGTPGGKAFALSLAHRF